MATDHHCPAIQSENFSTFLRHPSSVITKLENSEIRLVRRGAEDLVIARLSKDSQAREALEHLARLIAVSIEGASNDRLATALADECPWVEFLPADERREFFDSYFRLLRTSTKSGAFGRVAGFLNSWKETAAARALRLEPAAIDNDFLATSDSKVSDPRI